MSLEENTEFQIYCQSKLGYSIDGTPAQVKFDFNARPIIIPENLKFQLSVESATIKVSWYNINTNNNIIILNNVSYTIPEMDYDVYTLATALSTLLIGSLITVTYDSYSSYFTFTSYGSNFTIGSLTTCDDLLGLNLESGDLTSSGLVLISTNKVDLSYTSNIYVTSSDLMNVSRNTFSAVAQSDVIASIQVTVNSGGIVFYTGTTWTTLIKKRLDQITIILKDEDNNILDLHGGWWNMTLNVRVVHDLFFRNNAEIMQMIGNI